MSKKPDSKIKEEKVIEEALAKTDVEATKLPDDKKLKTRGGYSSTKYKKFLNLGVSIDTTTARLEQYIEERNSLFHQLKDTEEFKAMEAKQSSFVTEGIPEGAKKTEIPFAIDQAKAA